MNNLLTKIIPCLYAPFFYHKLNKILEVYQTKKLAMNSTALIHASSASLLSISYFYNWINPNWIRINSTGYFIFDFIYLIKNRKMDKLRLMYLYHHIATISYISLDHNKYNWPYVMLYAELSNIPSYFVYHSMKKDLDNGGIGYKSKRTKILKNIQLITYTIIRLFVLGYYGYLDIKKENRPLSIYLSSVLYVFGCIWWGSMIRDKYRLENLLEE